MQNGDRIWKWSMRTCAVAGFVTLLIADGLDAPTSYYILLLGLFFGYDAIKGRIRLIVEEDKDDESA